MFSLTFIIIISLLSVNEVVQSLSLENNSLLEGHDQFKGKSNHGLSYQQKVSNINCNKNGKCSPKQRKKNLKTTAAKTSPSQSSPIYTRPPFQYYMDQTQSKNQQKKTKTILTTSSDLSSNLTNTYRTKDDYTPINIIRTKLAKMTTNTPTIFIAITPQINENSDQNDYESDTDPSFFIPTKTTSIQTNNKKTSLRDFDPFITENDLKIDESTQEIFIPFLKKTSTRFTSIESSTALFIRFFTKGSISKSSTPSLFIHFGSTTTNMPSETSSLQNSYMSPSMLNLN